MLSVKIVQEEGEFIMIPPKWYHQVYHLQPSIALAAQYCNNVVADKVITHILEWCNVDRRILSEGKSKETDTKTKILSSLRCALVSRHGSDVGIQLYKDLFEI